jgi:hypothetical protein
VRGKRLAIGEFVDQVTKGWIHEFAQLGSSTRSGSKNIWEDAAELLTKTLDHRRDAGRHVVLG